MSPHPSDKPVLLGTRLMWLFAITAGASVANIYYAQPLTALVGQSLNIRGSALGLMVTVTQLGYASGLVLLVPLGDLVENRRLISTTLMGAAVGLGIMGWASRELIFFVGAAVVGLCSVAAQMVVPFAAQLAPDATRGRVVGNVMSGLMAGILLARPAASGLAAMSNWRWVFKASGAGIFLISIILRRALPRWQPPGATSYRKILGSLLTLLMKTPVLQRRASYQAALFGCFSLFWTAVPLVLASPAFRLSQRGIALFALAGAGGALVAPVAGRLADRGWIRLGTGLCIGLVAASFGLSAWGVHERSLAWMVLAAVVLDVGATANLVLGQREIFSQPASVRSRLNGLFIAIFMLGGAAGSALSGLAFSQGNWMPEVWIGLTFSAAAGLLYISEYKTA